MNCTKCNRAVPNTTFCIYCGSSLSGEKIKKGPIIDAKNKISSIPTIPQYLYSDARILEIEQKIADIETTMAQVLRDAEAMPSTFAAAMALVQRRLSEGGKPAKEQVHAC